MGFRIINGKAYPVGNFSYEINNPIKKEENKDRVKSFKELLNEKSQNKIGVKISNHAAERMQSMRFNSNDMKVIEGGINKAAYKGAKNTLMLYKDVAFIASVENKTIITAIEKERMKENVFTNIDSVIIL